MHVSLWFSVKEDDQRFPLEIGLLRVCPALHCCWMPYSRTLHQGLRRLLLTASSSAPLLKLLLPEVSTRRQHFLLPHYAECINQSLRKVAAWVEVAVE